MSKEMSKEMACCAPQAATPASSSGRTTPDLIRSVLGNRRVLVIGGLAVAAGASALNWSWLAAIGATSVILALAPCAVMCALGLCMMPKKKDSDQTRSNATEPMVLPKTSASPELLPAVAPNDWRVANVLQSPASQPTNEGRHG